MRPTTSVAASTVRALITSVPETSLRELFIEWALAALRYLVVSPESKPTAPTSADRARRHWTKARREAQQRERRRLARAGNSDRRGRKGRANTGGNARNGRNGRVSPEALWQHTAKLMTRVRFPSPAPSLKSNTCPE